MIVNGRRSRRETDMTTGEQRRVRTRPQREIRYAHEDLSIPFGAVLQCEGVRWVHLGTEPAPGIGLSLIFAREASPIRLTFNKAYRFTADLLRDFPGARTYLRSNVRR